MIDVAAAATASIALALRLPRVRDVHAGLRAAFPAEGSLHALMRTARCVYAFIAQDRRVRRFEAMNREARAALVRATFTSEGVDHLAAAIASGRPIVLATPHYGNMLALAYWIMDAVAGRRDVILFLDPPERDPEAAMIASVVEGAGMRTIFNRPGGGLRLLRALKERKIVIVLFDAYDVTESSTFVPMFGKMVCAMPGTAYLAIRTDAVVLPLFCTSAHGRNQARLLPAVRNDATNYDAEGRMYALTAYLFEELERFLTNHFELWHYWESLSSRMVQRLDLPYATETWTESVALLASHMRAHDPELATIFDGLAFELAKGARNAR